MELHAWELSMLGAVCCRLGPGQQKGPTSERGPSAPHPAFLNAYQTPQDKKILVMGMDEAGPRAKGSRHSATWICEGSKRSLALALEVPEALHHRQGNEARASQIRGLAACRLLCRQT